MLMTDLMYIQNGKIDVSEEGILYWSQKLDCSPNVLKKSITEIGCMYNTLILYMEMNNLVNKK